jgi:heme/copper-type cytochrome/quinol oxidase subunit 2
VSDGSTETLALVEMLAVFGLVLGFCVWQLVSVRREARRRRQDRKDEG